MGPLSFDNLSLSALFLATLHTVDGSTLLNMCVLLLVSELCTTHIIGIKSEQLRMRRRETMRLRRKKGPTARNFSSFVDDAHNVCTITVYFV